MGKGRLLFGLVLAFGVMSAGWTETLINSDFTKGDTSGWTINSRSDNDEWKAGVREPSVPIPGGGQVVRLCNDANGQGGTMWTNIKGKYPSWSFTVDIRFTHAGTACPADGATMTFAACEPNFIGGLGGASALFGGDPDGNVLERFTGLDINVWYGQGLPPDSSVDCNEPGRISETFAWNVVNPGTDNSRSSGNDPSTAEAGGVRIAQIGMPSGLKLVNGGLYRIQMNADQAARTLTAYITGLEPGKNDQFKAVKVLETKFPDADPVKNLIDFEGRWGITAATGGLVFITDVVRARVDAPAVAPL